jgi:hypothetical protein
MKITIMRCLAGAVLVASTAAALPAHATHKSWALRQLGISCFPSSPTTTASKGSGFYINQTAPTGGAICPVNLSGMWASNGGFTFDIPLWVATRWAKVYVYNFTTVNPVTCSASALATTGSTYWSQSVASSGLGHQTILLNADDGHWGGSLGVGSGINVRSMNYHCSMHDAGRILGHETLICQRDANCFGGNND